MPLTSRCAYLPACLCACPHALLVLTARPLAAFCIQCFSLASPAGAHSTTAVCPQATRLHLPRVGEGGSLASVLDHAMYCGGSLGRVGLDFRPLLAPLFEQAVLALYAQVREWMQAEQRRCDAVHRACW